MLRMLLSLVCTESDTYSNLKDAYLVEVILVLLGLVSVQLDLGGVALLVGTLDSNPQVLFTQEQGDVLLRAGGVLCRCWLMCKHRDVSPVVTYCCSNTKHTHTHMHAHTQSHTHIRTHIHMHKYAHTHTHTNTATCGRVAIPKRFRSLRMNQAYLLDMRVCTRFGGLLS